MGLILDVPVDPDAGEARRLVLEELAKPEYQHAQPTWFDRLATSFLDWLTSLSFTGSGGPPWTLILILAIVVVVGVGIGFLVFGLPRRARRSAVTGALFGEDDDRDAATMRAAAAASAARGDYTEAVAEIFRALARGLAERAVLSVTPGTTAHDFAARAAVAFPASADGLASAASAFDAVRYLGRDGTREQYDRVLALDATLGSARPVLEPVGA